MIVDLVKTTATDGIRLDGALHVPSADAKNTIDVDAILCLHGVASNFYGATMMEEIAPPLLELGAALLWANTRGHDNVHMSYPSGRPRRQGAAYETVDECRHDIDAWVNFLVERGFSRIALLGHSLGAIKSVYSQAYQPHEAVSHVIAVSPPRLSYQAFQNGMASARFFEAISTAEQHVEQGQPESLLEVGFPFPLLITAGGYVDKYGKAERYNILQFAHRLSCPTLFCYGANELERGGVAFAGLPEALAELPWPNDNLSVATIPEADHVYTGLRAELAEAIVGWLLNGA